MKVSLSKFILFLFTFFSQNIHSQTNIYDFTNESDLSGWMIVNDDVMGGVSRSNLKIDNNGNGFFYGQISTAYNGGFASVRYSLNRKYIKQHKNIKLRIKGDKKKYQLRIKTNRDDYYSYILPFKTSGEWETVSIPLKDMYPTFRGSKLNMDNFNDNYFEQISFLIANNRNEYFKLLIDSISLE